MIWLELVLLLAALGAVVLLSLDLSRGWLRGRRQSRHLERLDGAEAPPPEPPPAATGIGRRLLAAGLPAATPVYLGVVIGLVLVALFGVLEAFPGNLAAALLAALVAAWIPWSLLGSWGRYRARRFEEKLVDAVAFMTSALGAGESPTRALASAAEAAEGAVAGELRRVVARLDAGAGIREAMAPLVAGYDSEGSRLFAQTLIAKWAAAAELAPVLGRVGQIMRQRLAMRLRLRAELAGARLSAVIVALLPYLLIPVLQLLRPEWIDSLFGHPIGRQLLFVAILLQLVGILWMRRMMRMETG